MHWLVVNAPAAEGCDYCSFSVHACASCSCKGPFHNRALLFCFLVCILFNSVIRTGWWSILLLLKFVSIVLFLYMRVLPVHGRAPFISVHPFSVFLCVFCLLSNAHGLMVNGPAAEASEYCAVSVCAGASCYWKPLVIIVHAFSVFLCVSC